MCRCGGAGEHEHLLDPKAVETRSLYEYLMVNQCTALNTKEGDMSRVLGRSYDPTASLKSDCDDQMILQLRFSGSVKIKTIRLALAQEYGPSMMLVYANQSLDFTSIERVKPTQEFACISNQIEHQQKVIEYQLKAHLFGNVASLTILFKNPTTSHTMIRYLGFAGDFVNSKAAPVITQYELKPQLSDHKSETDWQKSGNGMGF